MTVKDNLIVFPFTTVKRYHLYPQEIDLKENFSRFNSLVVSMSIRNDPRANDVFVFVVKGRKYLKLLTFESFGPLVQTLGGVKAKEVLKVFQQDLG